MSAQENKAVVQQFWDEWNRGNMDGMFNLIDRQKVMDHSLPPGFGTDFQAISQAIGMYHQAFPGMQSKIEDLIAEGDKVVVRLTFTGTNKGELMGMPATGKTITNTGLNSAPSCPRRWVDNWT